MKLVFTGIQGCGKGTQARLLVNNYGYTLIEMGQALREISKQNTPLGKLIKETQESGKLVTPDIVCEIMKETLLNQKNDKLILDGFVRNIGNKECLEKIFPDYKVVFFNLSKEKAIDRLLGRMYNPNTGETFPSGTIFDPITGDELIKRKDDNAESILTRIDEYMNNTLPTALIQKNEGKVIEINADQSIEEVAGEMIKKLSL